MTSATFVNKVGWKAGSTVITESELTNPANAATLLKDTYTMQIWSRS